MPAEDYMSDDFVASLMKKDAKDSSIKYSTVGLQALLPKRPTTNAPRPNTQFLKNIIRETDSHNAALKAKEAEEARVRLRKLRAANEPKTLFKYQDESGGDGRRHKRRRLSPRDEDDRPQRSLGKDDSKRFLKIDGTAYKNSRRYEDSASENEPRASKNSSQRDRRPHHHRSHRRRSRTRSRSPHLSSRQARDDRHKRRRRHRSSPSRSRDREHSHRKSQRRKPHSPSPTPKPNTKPTPPCRRSAPSPSSLPIPSTTQPPDSESDPLESLIGPLPPPKAPKPLPRGRGTISSSAIDTHFSSTYDPATDMHPGSDSEQNDWDQALEALRDRKRWQQQGADRLRQAGFTEDEIGKWERGGEKGVEDVRWRGKGEGREWDRGKVVGGGGEVETEASWGRLKGT
ncbi:hypothetical protein MMC19_001452 [Ptychographa xylographoides]|nr:hypothetical protein [Ptychographa xylographoides]